LDTSINNIRFSETGIIWGIAASILLHILIMVVVPTLKFSEDIKPRQTLKIELQKPMSPAPIIEPSAPIDTPEPTKPNLVKKKIKPIVKPKPIKKEALAPVETPQEITQPPVIAVQPTAEKSPAIIVPEPPPVLIEPPPPPPQPSQADKDSAKNAYSNKLGRAFAKHKYYPKMAERRGQQGTVVVTIEMDGKGNVLSVFVSKSSGYASLDKSALRVVKKASPLPRPPAVLLGDTITITVPLGYKLEGG